MMKLLHILGNIWKKAGEPFPQTTRFFRHALPQKLSMWGSKRKAIVDVAVIIPCHNYAHYLELAIDSVLAQTVRPREILIVDDASDDDTALVVLRYAAKGVSYLRVEHSNLSLTRNSGAAATTSSFLLYLDADDRIPPEYIEQCLGNMQDRHTGFVYADIQEFNERTIYHNAGEFDKERIARYNFISSHALIRRRCFDRVGGYRSIPHIMEDWDFYRRITADGYVGKKAETYSLYNIHGDSMFQSHLRSPHCSYLNAAALLHQPITIFTLFNGRHTRFDRYLAGLLSLHVDPSMIRLFWYNTNNDPAFDRRLRDELARLPFGSVRYMQPLPSEQAMLAYTTIINECTTDYILTLAADTIVEPDTLRKLLERMDYDVAAVTAPYGPQYGNDIEEMDTCHLTCTLLRTSALRSILPLETEKYTTPSHTVGHEKILCDWGHIVRHATNEDVQVSSSTNLSA